MSEPYSGDTSAAEMTPPADVSSASVPGPHAISFDELISKPKRTAKIPFGGDKSFIKVQALSQRAWDDLISQHAPTAAQKRDNMVYNPDTFPQALVSACAVEPRISPAQAEQLFASDNYSGGELQTLFYGCSNLCNTGLDVPFTPGG